MTDAVRMRAVAGLVLRDGAGRTLLVRRSGEDTWDIPGGWVEPGETVGYGCAWSAPRRSRIATLSAGYADGLPRALGGKPVMLWAAGAAAPMVGRVSMDLITVDVTDLPEVPDTMEIINAAQGVDALAALAGTIGYEILTALGPRYRRDYLPG